MESSLLLLSQHSCAMIIVSSMISGNTSPMLFPNTMIHKSSRLLFPAYLILVSIIKDRWVANWMSLCLLFWRCSKNLHSTEIWRLICYGVYVRYFWIVDKLLWNSSSLHSKWLCYAAKELLDWWILTSITPGSGVTFIMFKRGSGGGRYPSNTTGMSTDSAVCSATLTSSR